MQALHVEEISALLEETIDKIYSHPMVILYDGQLPSSPKSSRSSKACYGLSPAKQLVDTTQGLLILVRLEEAVSRLQISVLFEEAIVLLARNTVRDNCRITDS